jgi:hypothetical protein
VPGSPDASLAEYLDQGGGFRIVALQSDDLADDVAAMRARGVEVGEIRDGGRHAGGQGCAGARPSSARGMPCRSSSSAPPPLARQKAPQSGWARHPNG